MFDLDNIRRFLAQEIELYGDEPAMEKNGRHRSPNPPPRNHEDEKEKDSTVQS